MTKLLVELPNRFVFSLLVVGWIFFPGPVLGIQLEELDATRQWRVGKIEIAGNAKFSDSEILGEMLTKVRPWYLFWEKQDLFDPITFREDLERIRRFYEARGYYQTQLTYDLAADSEKGQLQVKIEVFEGPPVIISQVNVEISGGPLSPPELPIKQGEIFVEDSYRKGEEALRNFFLERGYAYVATERRAEVNVDQDQARVWYQADPGPLSVFGKTTVQGTAEVDPEIVLRELTYQPGEIFSPAKIAESQAKIVALDLFGLVRVAPKQVPDKPSIVPMEVAVSEKEAREIRVGVGYGTEDRFRAQLRWQHNNWLGGGRRLSIEAKYSSIFTTGAMTLVQPHFFSPRTRGILSLRQDREDEDTYLLNASRFNPRLEHGFSSNLTGFVGYRLEYDRFDRISTATIEALGPVRERGLVSGPSLGLVWNTSDGPLNPTKGEVVTFNLDQAGEIWGGQFSFYKITAEAKKYLLLGWETVLASRLKIGFAEPLGPEQNLPISERLYAGGEKSVRGYARRKLGPLNANGDPIGGLSLIEGSLELRRPIWGPLGGALFIDFGQVSTRSFHLPVNDLKFGSGFGLNYRTPVGPLALYLGFPWRPPRGESTWQIYFSVGAYFSFMEKFWRFCRWLRLALVILLVLGVAGLAFYTHTDSFREFVRQKLVTAINDAMRGKVSIARLDGSVWGSLTLIDVRLVDNESEIARIPRLEVNYALLPLIWGRIQVLRLEAAQPLVWLKEGRDGVWNIVEALSPVEPQSETPSLVVSIRSLELQKADIDVSFSGNSYRLTGLDLQGTAGIRSDVTTVDLRQVSSRVLTKDMPEARVRGALAYEDRGGLESLKFNNFIIESGSSGVSLTGKIDDLKTFETTAKVSIDKLTPVDIAGFAPQWPVKAPISGSATLEGPLNALKANFVLTVADGSLTGNVEADVASESPAYQGRVKIVQMNLSKLLERKELRGSVSALVEVKGNGFSLANLAGQGEANIRSTEVAAWNLGDVSLKASLAHGAAKTTGNLTSELGHADWQGQIAFKDIPQYQLSFSASQLDIQKISSGQTIKGSLNLAGTIEGSGLTLAAMNTLAKIDVQRSKVGGVELEQGTLVATVADQRIRIEQGMLKATDAMLSVKGDIGTDPKQQGQLDYQLRVNTLSPWLALVDRQGSGSVNLAGGAKGNLNDLKAQGKLTVRSISFAGTTVQSGSINYDLGYSSLRALPFGTLNVNLSDIRAGYQMQSLDGVIKILPQTPAVFDLDVKARDAQNRNHTVAARLDYQPGHLLARVTRLTFDLPDGTWRLSQPVTVEQRDQDFLVDRLLMRNNGRELFLDGQFSLTGNQALRLNVAKLPLEAMRAFFPEAPVITGILSAEVQLGGTAAAPQILASLRLENSKIAGYSYAGLTASGSYRDQKAGVKATVQQDQLHRLDANATLPVSLSWNNGLRFETAGEIDSRIQSSGLSLSFLNAFSGKAIQGIAGEVEVDLQVRGSLNQPVASGRLRVRDGKLTPTALGVQVSSVTAEGLLEPRGVKISQISARANKGELSGSGFIALQKFVPQGIDLAVAAKQWPAINTQRYQIEVDGAAKIDGTFAAPRITGKFEVPKGELRPDLSFLDHGGTPVKRDPTITVVSTTGVGNGATKPDSNGKTDSEIWRNMSLDIQVRIPNDLWVRHRNGNVELSGNLRVNKSSESEPAVTGLIETVRGWVGFQGRRFTLSRGKIEFYGSEKINPLLDIVAEYKAGNYLVSAVVKGTAEKPTLTLSSDPQLDQADILSVLLFNKPISSLEKSEQASLQQNAISITSGFAAASIGNAVSEALGLQELGVDIGNVDFSGGQVRYGQYVGRNTYVSFSQEVSGKYGREISAEYQITPEWRFSVSSSTSGPDGADLIWQKRY